MPDLFLPVVLVLAGTAAMVVSAVLVSRANHDLLIPIAGMPPRLPGRAIAARGVGAVLLVVGTVLLAPTVGVAAFLVILVGFAPILLGPVLHNRRHPLR